jgi:hypothetical protein
MSFIATNGLIILLLVVVILFFLYELYFKSEPPQELPTFIDVELEESSTQIDDKNLDKDILEAVKIAIKIHREKANE